MPLLWGNRWPDAPRSFYAGWDQGHVLAFALWTALLLRRWWGLSRRGPVVQLAAGLAFALGFGLAAEGVQALGGNGPPSLLDMSRNLLGALAGWAFLAPGLKVWPSGCRWSARLTVGLLIAVSLLPLGRALVDEHRARRTFPLLAAFNTPFELDRWSGGANYAVTRPSFAPRDPMLAIEFLTDKYSGVFLNHFPRDWRGFTSFAFKAYNPDPTPLDVVCRINDRRHNREGHRHRDRFNRRLDLPPGWSQIRLSLEEIAAAPETRPMDLDDVLQVGLFTVALPDPRRLYLDEVRLIP
jgi:hypothetical protein